LQKGVVLRVAAPEMDRPRALPLSQHSARRAEVGRKSLMSATLDVRHADRKGRVAVRLLYAMMSQSVWTALSRGRSQPSVSRNLLHLHLRLLAAGQDEQLHLWAHLRSRRRAAQCHCP